LSRTSFVNCAASLAALALIAPAAAQRGQIAPEAATGVAHKTLAIARTHMVVAANPLAVEAGLDILDAGGSAVDAAIAVQLVLNLVEPQSSGLGGGAFLLHWDAKAGVIATYDGRETAPAAARPAIFSYGSDWPGIRSSSRKDGISCMTWTSRRGRPCWVRRSPCLRSRAA